MRISKNSGQRYSLAFSTLNLFLILFVSAYGGACTYEEDTRVQVDGNVPPTFKLDGSGHQTSFVVTEIPAENQVLPPHRDPSKNIDLWEIVPNEGTPDRAWDWPPITYGKVPPGFKQKTPISGVPPTLTAGKVYAAGGEAYGANGGEVWFTITVNHSKEVAKPGGH